METIIEEVEEEVVTKAPSKRSPRSHIGVGSGIIGFLKPRNSGDNMKFGFLRQEFGGQYENPVPVFKTRVLGG